MSELTFNELFADVVPGSYISFNTTPSYSELLVNTSFRARMGYESPEDFLAISGTHVQTLVHPDDFTALTDYISELHIHEPKDVDPLMCRMRKGDCSYAYMRMRGQLYNHDKREYVLFNCDDISKQMLDFKKLDSECTSSQTHMKFLDDVLNALPCGVHTLNLSCQKSRSDLNQALLDMVGYTEAEFRFFFDGDYTRLIHEKDRARYKECCARIQVSREPEQVEYQIVGRDGHVAFVREQLRVSSLSDGNDYLIGAVSLFEPLSSAESAVVRSAACPYGIIEFVDTVPVIVQCNGVFRLCFADAGFVPDGGLGKVTGGMKIPFRLIFPDEQFHKAYDHALEHFAEGSDRFRWTQRIFFSGRERPVVFSLGVLAKRDNQVIRMGLSATLLPERERVEDRPPRVRVVTFGEFDVYVRGEILTFHSKKGKEMLAMLIDSRGNFLSTAEIVERLWPEDGVTKTTMARTRKVAMRLMRELKDAGIGDIVETGQGGFKRIIPHLIDCDVMKFYDHDPKTRKSFQGRYLMSYPWARDTREDMIQIMSDSCERDDE